MVFGVFSFAYGAFCMASATIPQGMFGAFVKPTDKPDCGVDTIMYSSEVNLTLEVVSVVILVNPVWAVGSVGFCIPVAPMMKSWALDVVKLTLAAVPLVPVAVWAAPSKGEAVLAPLMPKTTAEACGPRFSMLSALVMVIIVVPGVDWVAYQVSIQVLENDIRSLCVHAEVPDEEMLTM